MMQRNLIVTLVVVFLACINQKGIGQVKLYPTAMDAETSTLFTLNADGMNVHVSDYMDYHYAHFEFSGTAEIEVSVPEDITSYTISPKSLNIEGTVTNNKLRFSITQIKTIHETPIYLVLQINGFEKLNILADRPEVDVPPASGVGIYNVRANPYNADSTGVSSAQSAIQQAVDDATNAGGGIVYIPYGLYQIKENLAIKSNVSLYLEPGAVLKAIDHRNQYPMVSGIDPAVIIYNAQNVKIYGRGEINASGLAIMNPLPGVLTSQSVDHPRRRVILTENAKNVTLNGIITKDGTGWSVELRSSDTALVQNIKLLNHKDIYYKIQNDGINSVSSSNTWVNQCFVMTIDDAMCSKARYGQMENCTFSNNVIYTSAAGVKAGMQSVSIMKNIVFRNCDVVHARRGVGIDTKDGAKPITGVVFNDIRVEELEPTSGGGDNCVEFITELAPVDNITVRRLTCPTNNNILMQGLYDITNVHFEGMELNNKLVKSDDMANVTLGSGITITYSYDSVFSDDIVYGSTNSDLSSGWTNPEVLNNGIKSDVASNSAIEAWVEFSYTEAIDIYKARVYGADEMGTTWMMKYKNDTSTVWSNAFPDKGLIKEGWSEKTFYASATKIRFYFYNPAGNMSLNEIQCFADIKEVVSPENNDNCILIEPEDLMEHELFAPFYVAGDSTACNGSYVEADVDGNKEVTPGETGRVVAQFYIDSAAKYYIYLRVITPSVNDDSFWLITDGDAVKYNLIKGGMEWRWVETPKAYNFDRGLHTLQIVNRESNTKLDQILVTTSAELPTGCNACGNIFDPNVVYHTLNSQVEGSGTIIIEPDKGAFIEGTSVKLTAVPDEDFFFDGWSGDTVSSLNPINIIMDASKSITANYILQYVYLTTGVNGLGSVTISPESEKYEVGSEVTLTAVPDQGNTFDGWSGSAAGTLNPLIITMDENKNITATFVDTSSQVGIYRITGNSEELMVYPNPFNNKIIVLSPMALNSNLIITLLDGTGKVLIVNQTKAGSSGSNVLKINTTHIPVGIYFLKVVSEADKKISQTIKLVKH